MLLIASIPAEMRDEIERTALFKCFWVAPPIGIFSVFVFRAGFHVSNHIQLALIIPNATQSVWEKGVQDFVCA